MSRPGDESKVGSQRHRRHSQLLRQLAAKTGLPSPSLIANVRETAVSINGGPVSAPRPASTSTSPLLPAGSSSPSFVCRCPVDSDAVAVDEAMADPAPVRRARARPSCPGVESLRPELAAILDEVRCVTRKLRSDDKNDEETSDWKFAAMVIDRLSFWTLTVYLVVVTVAVFGSVLVRGGGSL